MSKTWKEWDIQNKDGESVLSKPWMLRSCEEAIKEAEILADGMTRTTPYIVVEKVCAIVHTTE